MSTKQRRQKPKEKPEEKKKAKISDYLYKKPEGRQNRYVFKGFHEQLNSITARISHTNNKRYGHLREDEATRYLMGFGSYENDDETKVQLTSNFISMMNSVLKMNKSIEFKELHSELQQYTSSYNFVVLKKDEIVQMLLQGLNLDNPYNKMSIIDLLTALVKDLRSELSFEALFTQDIFPKVIECIHVTDVQLLEQIMTFFSYCFKYMLPVLLNNFDKFYKVYFKVINHSNKYVRRFAAESFSHILRKIKKENLSKIINEHCLMPFAKPYKYLSLEKINNEDMDTDSIIVHDKDAEVEHNEIFENDFWVFEKQLNHDLHNSTTQNKKHDKKYKFDLKQKQELISTISNLMVETVYGVQKKLYTDWKTLVDIMIDNIKESVDDQVWHLHLLRYTIIQFVPRLEMNAMHELVTYVIRRLGEESLSKLDQSNNIQQQNALNLCIQIVKDIFLYKEGYRAYPMTAVSSIGFLYKVMKESLAGKIQLGKVAKYHLVETLYIGYHNKLDEFIKIFDMIHKDNLISKFNKLGIEYVVHFYSLTAIVDVNQKLHDFMNYEIILWKKGRTIMKNYYVGKDTQRMSLVFKPLAKTLFGLDDNEQFDKLWYCLVVIKHKIDLSRGQTTDYLELPPPFITKVEAKINKLFKNIISERDMISKSDTDAMMANKNSTFKLWIYVKVLVISNHAWCHDGLIAELDKYISASLYSQISILQSTSESLTDDAALELMSFSPNLNNSYNLAWVLKSNLLILKNRVNKDVPVELISNSDLNSYYLNMLNVSLPDDSSSVSISEDVLVKLSKNLFVNKQSIRRETMLLLHKLLFQKVEAKGYNQNPIDLMNKILSTDLDLDTEKIKVNDIHRLMNVFRADDVDKSIQIIYLYFLVGLYWIKFTPFHKTVHEALGEFLGKYDTTINSEFYVIIDLLNLYLSIKPNNSQLWSNIDEYFECKNGYKFIEIKDENCMEILTVFDNIFKGLGKGIEQMSKDSQQEVTDRFIIFLETEYYKYHNTSSNFNESQLNICKNDEQLLNNLVDSNTIKVKSNFLAFRRNSEQKLISYLNILQDVDRIKDTLIKLLSSRESDVQRLALGLISRTDTPGIKHYLKTLEAFVSDSDFKEEVSKFSLKEQLKPEHREYILPLIVRILVAKLHKKSGKTERKSIVSRRSQVYRFLASMSQEELLILIDLIIEPFKVNLSDADDIERLETKLSKSNFRMYHGYAASLEGIIKHLGTLVNEYLPILLTILTSIYKLTRIFYNGSKTVDDKLLEEVEVAEEDEDVEPIDEPEHEEVGHLKKDTLKRCTQISKLVLKRIKEAYEKYFFVEYIQTGFSSNVLSILNDGIEKFRLQNITSGSALLEIFHTWSKHVDLHFLFVESSVINQLSRVVSIGKDIVHHEVYSQIFIIFKNIVLVAAGDTNVDRRDKIIKQNLKETSKQDQENEGDEGSVISDNDISDDESDDDVQIDMTNTDNNISLKIIKTKLHPMIESIANFLQFNWEAIKNGIVTKKQKASMLNKFDQSAADKLITNAEVFKQRTFVKRIVYILSEISVHVNLDQKEILEKLADMLIPLVSIKGFISSSREELTNHTFLTIQRLCEKMPSMMTIKRFYKIGRLLADRLRLSTRMHICDLLYVIPDQKIKESVDLVKEMNKKKTNKASLEYDYDSALNACNKLADDFLKNRSYNEIVVGLFNCLWWSGELSIRTACVHVFEVFFDKYYSDVKLYSEDQSSVDNEDIISRSNFIRYHFLPWILRDISTSTNEMKLKACFKILRKYFVCIYELYNSEADAKACKDLEVPNDYIDFACTINHNDEYIDFFHNILNIKLQRRYKAIRQLCSKIEEKEIHDVKTLTKIVLLIADMFVLRLNEYKKSERGVVTYTKDNLLQINNECYILYEKVSQALPWTKYQNIIKKHIIKVTGVNLERGERMTRTSEKTLTKVICAMIHGFSFDVPDIIEKLEIALDRKQEKFYIHQAINKIFEYNQEEEEEKDPENDDDLEVSSEKDNSKVEAIQVQDQINLYLEKDNELDKIADQTEAIRTRIQKSFIPALFKHLTDQKTKKHKKEQDLKIRINVAVAITRLLRKTNSYFFNSYLNRLIRTIVVCLRSKMVSIRDIARDALTQVNLNISPYMLHITIDEMFKTLTRGYQRHVRSYTLHHLLEQMVKENHLKVGQIDHCLEKYRANDALTRLSVARYDQAIPKIVMDDLFGALNVEKQLGMGDETSNFHQIKESKANRTLATYEIIAKHINFERSFVTLIRPIIRKAETSNKQINYKKCEEIMDVISGAILKNPSVTAESLIVVLYSIMKRGTSHDDLEEEAPQTDDKKFSKKSKTELLKDTTTVLPIWSSDFMKARRKSSRMSKKIMVAFSLTTLKKAISVLPIEKYKEKLDSFCELYVGLMRSTDNKIVVNTLHLLGKWIKLGLPKIKFFIRKIINNLFILFQNTSDGEFMNSLFKCTAELVRAMKSELSEYHISKLVEIIKANLEHYSMQANVYGCLKAVIEKKIITPDVYDLIEIIGDKMITNVNKGVRSTWSKIYVQFLIEYPLEEKRVEQHVHHLIKNINYYDKDGRFSVLEVIERVVSRFPTEILDKYAFVLFLSLILRTVNEKMSDLKQKANNILKELLLNVSDSKRDDIIKTVLTWDYNAKPDVNSSLNEISNQCHESMIKRVTFLLINLIITIEGDKFVKKYFNKTIELLNFELEAQNTKIQSTLTQAPEEVDDNELANLKTVKKQMGDFFEDIDQMIEEEEPISTNMAQNLNKQELITMVAALNILDKFTKNPILFQKLYKDYMSQASEIPILKNLLTFTKLWSLLTPVDDPVFASVRNAVTSIITQFFENFDKSCPGYEQNQQVKKMMDDLSIIIVKHYVFNDQAIDMAMFVMVHLYNRQEDDKVQRLEKMFNMASYAGRRIMMNLKRDVQQIVAILRFFLMSISTIKDLEILKTIAKPMLNLGFKVYTNPQLNKSDTKVIAAELVETLQNKLDEYDEQSYPKTEEAKLDKSSSNSTFIQMYSEIKKESEISKKISKEKRKANRLYDLQRHKRKRSTKRKKKREADKKEREKYI